MSTLAQDRCYSLRMMRRSPLSTAIVVLTLGMAIGANGAIFGVVDTILLRPLPYFEADRLVQRRGLSGSFHLSLSRGMYRGI